jgi:hypothetical protein
MTREARSAILAPRTACSGLARCLDVGDYVYFDQRLAGNTGN